MRGTRLRLAIVAFNISSFWTAAAQLEKGLDLTDYQADDRYDLDAIEHHRQFGFSYYLIRAVRGLEEGITPHITSITLASTICSVSISTIASRRRIIITSCTFPSTSPK